MYTKFKEPCQQQDTLNCIRVVRVYISKKKTTIPHVTEIKRDHEVLLGEFIDHT